MALDLVQRGLCGGFAPHEVLNTLARTQSAAPLGGSMTVDGKSTTYVQSGALEAYAQTV